MLIISGQKLCGRVDDVPGKCYVKTRFIHFYYVPLIPLSSWVIEQGTERPAGFRGQQIPLSFKSVLFGWLQAGLIIFGVYNTLAGASLILNPHPMANNDTNAHFKLLLGALCLVVWVVFNIWPYCANEQRAKELTGRLGLPYETEVDPFTSDDASV